MKHWRSALALLLLAAIAAGGYEFIAHQRGTTATTPGSDWTPVTEQRMSHGRFADFTVYVPHGAPRGFVLLLSGVEGWTPAMESLAKRIAGRGALVAGLTLTTFNRALDADGAQCVYPDGDLENLSHFVQAYYRLPVYLAPIVAGYSAGATLAYAALVQAPANTFAGGVSVNFCPHYPFTKALCKGSGIEFTREAPNTAALGGGAPGVATTGAAALAPGMDFLPGKPGNAWYVVPSGEPQACDVASVSRFVAQVPGAKWIAAPPGGAAAGAWMGQAAGAFDALMAERPAAVTDVPGALADLPLVTVPAVAGSAPGDTFAIVLSGDGGWAGLDKDVAAALAAKGIPVIGLDSLRYFWGARTPAGLAADLDRITRYYAAALGKARVLLVGYSQGADVLPFAVNRLNAATRSHVALAAVMGMSEHALFEFHLSNWIADDDSGPATLPEVDKIAGIPLLCIYGEEENDTLCPKLDPHKATIVNLKGGHHFDGDYAGLARIILGAAAPH